MIIKDIMSSCIVMCDNNDSIYEVSILMKQNNIGFIPVFKDDEICGVITDRDIVVKCISNKCDISDSINSYITHDVISIDLNKDITCALELMADKQVKRLIITKNNKPIGILSLSDIINSYNGKIENYVQKIWKLTNNRCEKNTEIDNFCI